MTEAAPRELPVTGYFDRFSARPGGALAVHVSLRDGGSYRARLERVVSGDPNPDGPGLRFVDLAHRFDRTLPGRRQTIRAGSYALVEAGPQRPAGEPCTWTALVWMPRPGETRAVLCEEEGGAAVVLSAGRQGASARLAWPGGAATVETRAPMRIRRWYRVWLSADPATGTLLLGQAPLDGGAPTLVRQRAAGMAPPSAGTVLVAAQGRVAPARHFNGKIEAPAILPGAFEAWPDPARLPAGVGVHAAWDFSQGIGGLGVVDVGPQNRSGRVVNLPTRGVVGALWSGRETCFRHAPADYAAIHFHDDDIDDCRWAVDFELPVPADLPSGAYCLRLSCAGGEDRLPFYVLPARSGPRSRVAVLASTFTYQAYANHARGNFDAALRARAEAWGAAPYNPDDYPAYGRSTYNRHADGSGIAYSTRLRPILTMRPGFLTFNDPRGSGLRHYPADSHLLAWLEAKGIDFDVVTDEDLDEEGVDLIAPYRCLLTGSHPEYHTPGTLDALAAYTAGGGRLAYLGGNGFYWRAIPTCPASSRSAARRAASAPGKRSRASTTTPSTGSSAGCGGATGARRRCWPASASPARACSRARITAACPPPTRPPTPGSSPASPARRSAATGYRAAAPPASSSTAPTPISARRRMP